MSDRRRSCSFGGRAASARFTLWALLRWPAALLLSSLAVAIACHLVPNVRHRFQLISLGSVLSVVAWSVASLAFSYYVQNFANFDVMFGSIGAVIVLLAYIHLSITVLLFGAEVNAAIEQHAASHPDTPHGSRGATAGYPSHLSSALKSCAFPRWRRHPRRCHTVRRRTRIPKHAEGGRTKSPSTNLPAAPWGGRGPPPRHGAASGWDRRARSIHGPGV